MITMITRVCQQQTNSFVLKSCFHNHAHIGDICWECSALGGGSIFIFQYMLFWYIKPWARFIETIMTDLMRSCLSQRILCTKQVRKVWFNRWRRKSRGITSGKYPTAIFQIAGLLFGCSPGFSEYVRACVMIRCFVGLYKYENVYPLFEAAYFV